MFHSNYRFLSFLCVISSYLLISSSCDSHKVRRMLNGIMDATIVLPDNVSCVRNGNLSPSEQLKLYGKCLIVFVDSTECSRCRIDKLNRYHDYIALSEEKNTFNVLFLLSINKKSRDEVIEYLLLTEPDYPIYIDENNDFRSLNPSIPDDTRFHTILVNGKGKAILVGDPMANASIRTIFDNVITEVENGLQ